MVAQSDYLTVSNISKNIIIYWHKIFPLTVGRAEVLKGGIYFSFFIWHIKIIFVYYLYGKIKNHIKCNNSNLCNRFGNIVSNTIDTYVT